MHRKQAGGEARWKGATGEQMGHGMALCARLQRAPSKEALLSSRPGRVDSRAVCRALEIGLGEKKPAKKNQEVGRPGRLLSLIIIIIPRGRVAVVVPTTDHKGRHCARLAKHM